MSLDPLLAWSLAPLKVVGVNPFRGILMVVAAGIAFWRGWQIHQGHYAWMAYGLGVLALGLAVWHFATGRRPQR